MRKSNKNPRCSARRQKEAYLAARFVRMHPAFQHILQEWRVDDVTDFLQARDLHGPAAALRANGVNGRDLLNATIAELTQDVRLSPFAARKVLSVRDGALAA